MDEIDMIYLEIDACIQSFYDAFNLVTKEGKDRAYTLIMAVERLNDEIGRRVGVV